MVRGFRAGDAVIAALGDVERQQVDGVHEDHPDEDRQRQRRDEAAVAVEGVLDLAVDELDDHLDEGLRLGRHAGGRLARLGPQQEAAEQADDQRDHPRVDVEVVAQPPALSSG